MLLSDNSKTMSLVFFGLKCWCYSSKYFLGFQGVHQLSDWHSVQDLSHPDIFTEKLLL
jgi:hypothetical protein